MATPDGAPLLEGGAPAGPCTCSPRTRRSLCTLGLGQVITFFIAGTGICSQYLAQVNIPTTQSTLNYVLLSLHLVWWARTRKPARLQVRNGSRALAISATHVAAAAQVAWWKYALIALADVEANYLVVLAYQYTSITSIMLLDCFAIPVAMALSYAFLGTRYSTRHYGGVGLCLVGLGLLLLSDALGLGGGLGGPTPGPDKWKGDLLCLAGAALYAVSNVAQEAAVKGGDRVEYLGMLGAWGAGINTLQLLVVELPTLRTLTWSGPVVGLVLGFALCLCAMYVLTSHFLAERDATLFNLSMLTSDLWGILVGVLLFHQGLSWLYFLALAVIVGGIVTYNSVPLQQAIPGAPKPTASAAPPAAAAAPVPPTPPDSEEQALLPAPP